MIILFCKGYGTCDLFITYFYNDNITKKGGGVTDSVYFMEMQSIVE